MSESGAVKWGDVLAGAAVVVGAMTVTAFAIGAGSTVAAFLGTVAAAGGALHLLTLPDIEQTRLQNEERAFQEEMFVDREDLRRLYAQMQMRMMTAGYAPAMALAR